MIFFSFFFSRFCELLVVSLGFFLEFCLAGLSCENGIFFFGMGYSCFGLGLEKRINYSKGCVRVLVAIDFFEYSYYYYYRYDYY